MLISVQCLFLNRILAVCTFLPDALSSHNNQSRPEDGGSHTSSGFKLLLSPAIMLFTCAVLLQSHASTLTSCGPIENCHMTHCWSIDRKKSTAELIQV